MLRLMIAIALAASVTGGLTARADTGTSNCISGDYLEARTASVFAGPCHYNGELTTAGREAEMVWNIHEGSWNGVSLDGLLAMASIVSGVNLKDENAPRRAILYIDAKATPTQFAALSSALKSRYGKALGTVVAIKQTPISFKRNGETFHVEAKDITQLTVESMPNHECCKQPNLVWYTPLIQLKERKVGFTQESGIQDNGLGVQWTKNSQNTAFYGTFSI